jgi:hypothetical protein
LKTNALETEAAATTNKYLSWDEEMALGDCAKGVTKAEAMAMIDDLVNENVGHWLQAECSEKVFRRMLENHPDLVKGYFCWIARSRGGKESN